MKVKAKDIKQVKCQRIEDGKIVDAWLIGGRIYVATQNDFEDITDTHEILPCGTVQMLKWVLVSTIIILSAFALYSPN